MCGQTCRRWSCRYFLTMCDEVFLQEHGWHLSVTTRISCSTCHVLFSRHRLGQKAAGDTLMNSFVAECCNRVPFGFLSQN